MEIKGSSRRILIIVLGVLTVALLIVALLIGIRLQQSQAPTNSNAACAASYNGTTSFTLCGGASGGTVVIQKCSCGNATGSSYPSCVCNDNCTTQTITLAANETHTESVSAPSCGTAQTDFRDATGTVQTPSGSGVCNGAGHACTTGGDKACGDTCTSNSDCRNPSTAGAPVACVSGTCQNTSCSAGKTVSGANCECSDANACGQKCNSVVGLCQAGSTCTFVNDTQCVTNGTSSSTYCVPNTTYTTLPKCNAPTNNSDKLLIVPTGQTITNYLSSLCNPAVCGDGTVNGTEQCDPTAAVTGCSTGMSCGTDCKCTTNKIPLCGDTCTTNADCPSNNSCDATSKKCVLTACTVAGTTCTANSCTVVPPVPELPNTAIISDDVDRYLLGGLLLVLGAMAVKFKWINAVEDMLISLNGSSWDAKAEQGLVKRSRNKFEEEFDKKAEK